MQALFTPTTESGRLVVNELEKIGRKCYETDVVALSYTEGDDYGVITLNYFSTPITIKLSDIRFDELRLDGILIWATWEANL